MSRAAAGLVGSYAFVWGFAALATTLGVAAGVSYADARTLAFLFAFLVFLACFCWSFAAPRVAFVWAVLGGGSVVTSESATDGPFVEAKEIVGGFMIVSADSLAEAIESERSLLEGVKAEADVVVDTSGSVEQALGTLRSRGVL